MKPARQVSRRKAGKEEDHKDTDVPASPRQGHGRHSRKAKGRRAVAPLQPDKEDDATFQAEWKMSKAQEVGARPSAPLFKA